MIATEYTIKKVDRQQSLYGRKIRIIKEICLGNKMVGHISEDKKIYKYKKLLTVLLPETQDVFSKKSYLENPERCCIFSYAATYQEAYDSFVRIYEKYQ